MNAVLALVAASITMGSSSIMAFRLRLLLVFAAPSLLLPMVVVVVVAAVGGDDRGDMAKKPHMAATTSNTVT